MWSFRPFSKRETPEPSRVKEHLTETSRERISASISRVAHVTTLDDAIEKMRIETGGNLQNLHNKGMTTDDSHYLFIKGGEMENVIDYLEVVLNFIWENGDSDQTNRVEMMMNIERTLIEEGQLWKIEPDTETLRSSINRTQNGRYKSSTHDPFHFVPIADASLKESDEETQVFAKQEPWAKPLQPYNEAWGLYKDRTFTYVILEKLYNSVEAVCEEICVNREEWNSQGDSLSDYLDSMKENGLFDPDKSMIGQWENIETGIRVGIQKLGGGRKRHNEIDQDYAILMLHETSAFLNFVIKRYEEKYGV